MVTKVKTGKSRTKRRTKAFAAAVMGKPSGQIQERVKQAGPEHFGVVSVDCAKDRSKWMLADFYGRVLIPPTSVEHRRSEIQLALLTLKQAVEKHGIKDTIVAVEMTGTYHQIIWRAFRTAGYDTRIVHPFALKVLQYIAEHGGTHQALLDVGIPGVSKWLKQQNVAFQSRSVGRIVAWAGNQLPKHAYADEAKPLQEVQRKSFRSRRNEPQQLGTLLVGLLARLGVTIQPPALQSVPLEAPAADSDKGDR